MKQLSAKNVNEVFMGCLFKDGEETDKAVIAEGIAATFGFHPKRLESHENEITEMLSYLPDNFHADKGGGTSFLDACMTENGDQWGEHQSVEQLLALGIATKHPAWLLPRRMWDMLPGGMPYVVVRVSQII